MRKFLLIMLFLVPLITNNINAQNDYINQAVGNILTDSLTVGTSSVALPSDLSGSIWVTVTTEHPSGTVWFVSTFDTSATPLNGYGNLSFNETSKPIAVRNPNIVRLVSDTPGLIVKYMYAR